MATREEIREGLYIHLCKRDKGMDFTLTDGQQRWLVAHSLKYLHSQGVVIKVDRELPEKVLDEINEVAERYALRPNYANELIKKILAKAGYVATIPLEGR